MASRTRPNEGQSASRISRKAHTYLRKTVADANTIAIYLLLCQLCTNFVPLIASDKSNTHTAFISKIIKKCGTYSSLHC